MNSPRVILHPKVKKQIKALHTIDRKKTRKALEDLSNNFQNQEHKIKKLTNLRNSYRIRIGNVRLIFEKERGVIFVRKIAYRGQIY
ncbi:MAG: type II toxin-antitoxin system RelE/ParE family toxin [Patescibacteria group bacterium]